MNKNEHYTLVTGASIGIGRAFAFECASRGMNLLLVALPEPILDQTKLELTSKYSVNVISYATDLTEPLAIENLFNFVIKKRIKVDILVNNVGMGAGGRFENIPVEIYLKMINLNNQVMTLMTHYFLPMLKTSQSAFILNMSSMEATLPLPYKSVYTGTKNYIYAFSLALREELADSNVKVSVVCPGPVLTNKESLKRINSHGKRAKLIMLSPERVAKIGIDKLLKGKGVIVPGRISWVIVKMMKLVPTTLKMKMLERVFRVYKDH